MLAPEMQFIETRIEKLARIQKEIKILEVEESRLKSELINEYFVTNDSFIGSNGLVLATYKPENRVNFKTTEFKLIYPKIYDDFSEQKQIFKFCVKMGNI